MLPFHFILLLFKGCHSSLQRALSDSLTCCTIDCPGGIREMIHKRFTELSAELYKTLMSPLNISLSMTPLFF